MMKRVTMKKVLRVSFSFSRLFVIINYVTSVSVPSSLNYQVKEELAAGTQIGSGLLIDARMTSQFNVNQLAQLRFSIVRNPSSDVATRHLNVVSPTGLLEIKAPIDRDQLCPAEELCHIKFDVVVVCSTDCFNVITVVLDLIDINDHTPTFVDLHSSSTTTLTSTTLTLPESSVPGSQFPLPAAQDPDSPAFGVQRYDLFPVEARSTFALLRRRGPSLSSSSSLLQLVLSGPLDRETVGEYQLTVVAVDGGQPSLSSTCSVNIVISDVNDNEPTFQEYQYTVDVLENTTQGTLLTIVRATDDDIDNNAFLTYHLLSSDDVTDAMFVVNEFTGELMLGPEGQLDRERAAIYRLSIEARDHGLPVRSAITTVTINVIDVNDNQPQIAISTLSEDGRGHVMENAPIGTFVGLIAASDRDVGDNAMTSCKLELGSEAAFALVTMSGSAHYKLVTGLQLDRENTSEYHVVIVCTDHGINSLSSTSDVIVTVGDVNDNAPLFRPTSAFRFAVSENSSVGHVIAELNANDVDAAENARVSYSIVTSGSQALPVAINASTGVIHLKTLVDYEQLRNFRFQIEATDSGQPPLSSTANVTIDILDINDVTPTFSAPAYSFSVRENSGDDVIIGNVIANDSEEEENGAVRYSISNYSPVSDDVIITENNCSTSDGTFVVNPLTGSIMATKSLDRELKPIYRFTIVAIDSGWPRLTGSCDVTIQVVDENDNAPEIDVSVFDDVNSTGNDVTVYVSSAARRGRILTKIVARDADEGVNSALQYYISGADEFLQVQRSLGVILVTSSDLSALDGRQMSVLVLVVDGGSPPRSTSLNMTVIVNSSIDVFPVDLSMYVDDDVSSNDKPSLLSAANHHDNRRYWNLLDNGNLVIVIAVASATFVVALALIAAILCVSFRSHCHHYENATGSMSPSCRQRRVSTDGGALDESLSVFESLTGNDKLVADEFGRGKVRRCHEFESFGKKDNVRPMCCTSLNAVPSHSEGDHDSQSSDSGRGASEHDFNIQMLNLRPLPANSGCSSKRGTDTTPLNNGTSWAPQRSTLFPNSALPRYTSHELALGVNSSTFQTQTLPSSSASSHRALREGPQTQNTNPPSEMNTRSLRRVTFSNPEYISSHLGNDVKDNRSIINVVTEAASVTSLTSGSYVVQPEIEGSEDERWKRQAVSYILV